MYAAQDGRCALCWLEPTTRLHVDHDHKTGRVRGLLCYRCNKGLGVFRDNVEALSRAGTYVTSDFDGRKLNTVHGTEGGGIRKTSGRRAGKRSRSSSSPGTRPTSS